MGIALYRRYRPQSFADVIGQEHVTEPLMRALETGRVGHAYLFSGPRGCGKTTSARILARCLNCEQGPTPTPCGECPSCVALARGGTGSVDVIEIDAASHGGVDDARDLREKASYGPAQSRYKVYIIDEAHMVTPQGFNALLKIVEEPPEHVKFVFATTEPEKVIGTIRSRTHHYPFRLVPPSRVQSYLAELCEQEGVEVEPGVLSFIVRAAGGSVRDALSLLDQLIAGSSEEGLTYAGAAALLGFTESELLDATMAGLAAGDGASVFTQVDQVIETGHDPRRFIEDLLERLRDLIVISAVGDGAAAVLRGVPEDQLERMRHQAASFGPGQLSHAADIVNAGLTELSGATSPRLQLELICARLLLPGASGERGLAARLDRLERRLDVAGPPEARSVPAPSSPVASAPRSGAPRSAAPRSGASGRAAPATTDRSTQPDPAPVDPFDTAPEPPAWLDDEPEPILAEPLPTNAGEAAGEGIAPAAPSRADTFGAAASGAPTSQASRSEASTSRTRTSRAATARPTTPGPEIASAPQRADAGALAPAPDPMATPGAGPPSGSGSALVDTAALRRSWPDVLARIYTIRRVTWTFLSEHAQVLDYDGQRLLLGIATRGLANTFRSGPHAEVVRQALIESLGVDTRVESVPISDHAEGAGGSAAPVGRGRPAEPRRRMPPAPDAGAAPPPDVPTPPVDEPGGNPDASRAPIRSPRASRASGRATAASNAPAPVSPDAAVSADDDDVEGVADIGAPVIASVLGGTVIAELDE